MAEEGNHLGDGAPTSRNPEAERTTKDGVEAELRTFLIADIRGYTKYTTEQGADAAAELAGRFATIVREVVAVHDGYLLELRGDEALVVFVLARKALRAALELQGRFATELPRGVGIGLDAGEAIPIEGGYRGSALNLAARLCSQAGPGETLASEAVIHLAAKVEGIGYADPRTYRLKGMDQPIRAVHVVSAELGSKRPIRYGSDRSIPPLVRRAGLAAGIASIVVVALIVWGTSLPGATPPIGSPRLSPDSVGAGTRSFEPSPSPDPNAKPTVTSSVVVLASEREVVRLDPGQYGIRDFRPYTEFLLDRGGWEFVSAEPDAFFLWRRAEGDFVGYMTVGVVQTVIEGPCLDSATRTLPREPRALIDWLMASDRVSLVAPSHHGIVMGPPGANPVNVGGWPGLTIDIVQAKDPTGQCVMREEWPVEVRERVAATSYLLKFAGGNFGISMTGKARVTVLDVGGTPVGILVGVDDVARFDALMQEAERMLESLRFTQ